MAEAVMSCAPSTEFFSVRHWSPKVSSVPSNASQADIVVLHALASIRPNSPTQAEDGDAAVLCLEKVLQRDLPGTTISSFRATLNNSPWTAFTAKGIKSRAIELLKCICKGLHWTLREERSIIFIVFGNGELIVKKALLIAQDDDRFTSIRDHTSNLVSISPIQPPVHLGSREAPALHMIGTAMEWRSSSLPKPIEMSLVAIKEICEEFSSIAYRYNTVRFCATEDNPYLKQAVAEICSEGFDLASQGQFCTEGIASKLKASPEELEDELLVISDKIRSLADADPMSRAKWYPDYLSMLSHLRRQQYTYTPISEYPQTLNWLLSHTTYLAWLRNNCPCVLYIHGQCGIGKTALSSFLWKSLHIAGHAEEAGVNETLYFSFQREDNRRNSLLACQPQIFLSIWDHYSWIKWSGPSTVEELWIIFRSLISSPFHERVICIIDGIDQCDVAIDTTLQDFLTFSKSREAAFKVVATSRILPESFALPPLFSIDLDLQEGMKVDIKTSTTIHLHDLFQENGAFLEFENDIVDAFQHLVSHLGVILCFESLKGATVRSTPQSIGDALQSLSGSPSDVCDRIIKGGSELPPWARNALSWIIYAFRPMTFDELSIAVAIRKTSILYSEIEHNIPRDIARDLKQIFGGILAFNHNQICFVHQSVKDYLLFHLTSPSQDCLPLDLNHADLARHCLAYLCFADMTDGPPPEPVGTSSRDYNPQGKFDFLPYATEHWAEHYQAAGEKGSLDGDLLEILGNEDHLRRWRYPKHPTRQPLYQVSPLQTAAELGLTKITCILLGQDGANSITHADKVAALDMAVANGHLEAAIQLLNDEATSRETLSIAARHGHTELVRQLIHRNDLQVSGTGGVLPFHVAALRGHAGVIDILLEAGPIPKPGNTSEDTPFSLAVKGGQLAALRRLLKADSTVALTDNTEFSLLHLAAREGHLEIVRELIQIGADRNAIGIGRSTPLILAAERGHVVLVKYLVNDLRCDMKAVNAAGSCAVHVAAMHGYVQLLEQLHKAGADIRVRDKQKCQPIHLAAQRGHLGVTKFLLGLGVDPNTVEGRKLTPLHLAVKGRHLRIVQELLRHSRSIAKPAPDPEAKDDGVVDELDKKYLKTTDVEPDNEYGDESDDEYEDEPDDEYEDEPDDACGYFIDQPESQYITEATPLHSAAVRGCVDIVRELLKADPQCIVRDRSRLTPLHLAVEEGHVSVVKELLRNNADPNLTNLERSSPLHVACREGNLAIVQALLIRGADVSMTDNNQVSPLHRAAKGGHTDVVRQLLEAGTDPEPTNSVGHSPLHLAVSEGFSDTVAVLLANGADPNTTSRKGWTALHFAVTGKVIKTGLISQILKGGVNINASNDIGSTALIVAAESGPEAAVKALLEAGARADARNERQSTPIHRAAQGGNLAVVKLLMAAGANPLAKKRDDITPLDLALTRNHLDVVLQLLEPTDAVPESINAYEDCLCPLAQAGFEKGITKALDRPLLTLDKGDSLYGQSPLSLAAENGHEGVVRMLLDKGANPNSMDKSGRTPLSWAVLNEHKTIAKYLSGRNADMNNEDDDQWTPLTLAIQGGSLSMVELLLDLGANPLAQSSDGWTAIHMAMNHGDKSIMDLFVRRCGDTPVGQRGWTRLHLAAINGDEKSVREQLENGADKAVKDRNGLMPLHWAAARSHKEVVHLLLEMDTEVDAKDDEGMTALHYAASRDDVGTVKALLEKGAERKATDLHGWTPCLIAQMYAKDDVLCKLLEDSETTIVRGARSGMTPSCWVKPIESSVITISKDGLTAISDNELKRSLQIRTDQPMPAGAYTFYFEVKIVKAGKKRYLTSCFPFRALHSEMIDANPQGANSIIGIGFSEGAARRRGMPGWGHGSWGFDGDNGRKFSNGKKGVSYSDHYGTGDIIGCGVDFISNCAFFTKNGKKLGQAFEHVRGRLYPEVGIGDQDVKVTVNFGQNDFLFNEPS